MYQPQHEITISPYPLGGSNPFIFAALCACGWNWPPHKWERTAAEMHAHYVAEAMAIRNHGEVAQ